MVHTFQAPTTFALDNQNHMASSPKTGQGYLSGPGLHEYPVTYAVVDGIALHAGCIDLGPAEEVEAEAVRIRESHQKRQADLISEALPITTAVEDIQRGIGLPTNSSYLWTNGVVPYTIASSVPNQSRVDDAIKHIQEKTAIRFVRRTNSNASRYRNYIEIISNGDKGWSSSSIGMRGGRQYVRFSDRHSWQILVHEFLHALGIYHEQSRSDRDDYVQIQWSNIQDDAVGNFQKKSSAVDYFDYDYESIMHYPGTSFAKDFSKPTIVPLKSGVSIGQREGMSFGDRQTVAKMYERFFQKGYTGVWRAGSSRYGLWANDDWSGFKEKWQDWSRDGLRLQDIHVRRVGNTTRYSGVFLPGSGRYGLWTNVTWSSFVDKWREWSGQGLRLVDLEVHRVGNQSRYSGVFLPGSGRYGLWANVTWPSFKAKWQEWSEEGLRLVDLHVHRVNGENLYSGVFLPKPGGYALWVNASWSSFVAKWQEWSKRGYRLIDINVHKVGSSNRYSGVFLTGSDGYALLANVTFEGLKSKWEELAAKGLRLIDLEMIESGDQAADFADASFDGERDEPILMEPFGGIFGDEVQNKMLAIPDPEDGGGGMETGHNGSPTAARNMEFHGELVSPISNSALMAEESEEGQGGIVFDDTSEDFASDSDSDGDGGLVAAE
ncbi:MAG: M12 family metallopeptidase [Leptolyngbyaceae cyanobacterium]